MIASYHLFIADHTVITTINHKVDKNSPLDLVYHTTIQALQLEELSHYVNQQNPLLSPAHTILNEITYEQVPLLLRLFDILGGADLIYNIHQYPMLIAPPPPGSQRPSTATSPPVSSMSSSPPALPCACCLSGPTPQPCKSHGSSSPSVINPETAFGVSRAELDYTLNIVKTLTELPPSPVLNALAKADCPLTSSDPCYCQACYICRHLGHVCINCGLYECPLCHATHPGHTQAQCPSIHPRHPLQERVATPRLVDDHTLVGSEDDDLYDNDFDFDDSAIGNITREPYRE
ncbi:hypothetical protein M404DRAFT_34700 [Pisolithus tinctorius Marx 270]|uniref:Uncharacterized protein n=1 Tax=Pisolithus tinctorius Marx 270 TaxID=870435 RepID=A0A0C3JAW2_PISTI|nr:hypothetical protein M404DRAFT_34700 [Pisolithus tinctorius Marx 270]